MEGIPLTSIRKTGPLSGCHTFEPTARLRAAYDTILPPASIRFEADDMMRARILLLSFFGLTIGFHPAGGDDAPVKKIVLIAGTKSHGPGDHEYEKGLRLLAQSLKDSPDVRGIRVEVHTDGWPKDESTLDDAATIVLFCDGSDRDERAHPILHGDRLRTLERLKNKGIGLVALHYTVFVPASKAGDLFLDGIGGYFDYETGNAPNHWYSKIQNVSARCQPATPGHPVSRGLTSFDLKEEFYYNIRFRDNDPHLTPILTAAIPGEPKPSVVAWAVERADGGRGFGYTGGHYHGNWSVDQVRKMVLNAVLWTARIEVPADGVRSPAGVETYFVSDPTPDPGTGSDAIRTLIITGPQHPAHDWRSTTQALREVLERDGRFKVKVAEAFEAIASPALSQYDLVVLNTMNWQRPGPDEAARKTFLAQFGSGRGLAVVHFANGAFFDWPPFHRVVRRYWLDGPSGHDAFGPFRVQIEDRDHPITKGLSDFDTLDELYFRQQGDGPIHVLATARSKVTNQQEPMAFTYDIGSSHVFQTVLGHEARSIRGQGVAELIRRGFAWAAGREVRSIDPPGVPPPPAPGRFGKALDPRRVQVGAKSLESYRHPPLTVECWARLESKERYNILVANDAKESASHWEIYSNVRDGHFHAYFPGAVPSVIDSGTDIVDGHWHHLAMLFEVEGVRLFVDGKLVHKAALTPKSSLRAVAGGLSVGGIPAHGLGCDGLIDEVRIRRGIQAISGAPSEPLEPDAATVALWDFDELSRDGYDDRSVNHNRLIVGLAPSRVPSPPAAGPSQADALDYRVADAELCVTLLDRVAGESLLSIRPDSEGRLFVGGREGLFVYDPDPKGSYQPRRLLARFPAHTWINDIAIRGNDLYVMTNAALYLLPDARVRRSGILPRRLIWGWPVDLHVTLHGMAWGPEGDLYFTAGDPLLNYGDYQHRPDHWGHWTIFTQPDGTRVPYTGQGGVFRCKPDGTRLEVLARGTRGSFGLCFDRRWNLFTNDNDHESIPAEYSPARLLHVFRGADFSWPRGWTSDKHPERLDLLETVYEGTGLGREVPVGMAYCDEPNLPESYRDHLLLARWGQRRIDAFRLIPRGASWRVEERPLLIGENQARPVGVAVGTDGRIFGIISYMQNNEWSPSYIADLIVIASKSVRDHDAAGAVTRFSVEQLWDELKQPSWRRRDEAHQELLRRGKSALAGASPRLRKVPAVGREGPHLCWLAAQAGDPDGLLPMMASSPESDRELRLAALRARSIHRPGDTGDLTATLADRDPCAVLAALEQLRAAGESPHRLVIEHPARSEDSILRQAATRYLAERATVDQLAGWCSADDVATRRAGVLAVGARLTIPPLVGSLPSSLPLRYEAKNAEFEVQYADARVNLRAAGPVGSFTIAERWKALPHRPEEERLFDLLVARADDRDLVTRSLAGYYLNLLNDPRGQPIVDRIQASVTAERLAKRPIQSVDEVWIMGPFPSESSVTEAFERQLENGPIDLSARYKVGPDDRGWVRVGGRDGLALDRRIGPTPEGSFFYAFFRLQSSGGGAAAIGVEGTEAASFRINGQRVVGLGTSGASRRVAVSLLPGSNDIVVTLRSRPGPTRPRITYQATGERVVATMPENLGRTTLAERLKSAAASGDAIPPAFLDVDWSKFLAQGDIDRGRQLFGPDGLGCGRCHAVNADQAVSGGPSLADAAQRFSVEHVVESILAPSKVVAPIFRASTLATRDGEVLNGLVTSEDDQAIEILLPNAARRIVARSQIEERKLVESSPMPAGLITSPDELRDLLAYLFRAPRKQAP